jgi:hypothetical protein
MSPPARTKRPVQPSRRQQTSLDEGEVTVVNMASYKVSTSEAPNGLADVDSVPEQMSTTDMKTPHTTPQHSEAFLLMEDATSSVKAHRLADFLTVSVLLSIIAFCLNTEKSVEGVCGYECMLAIDLFFVAIFTIEFVARVYVYRHDTITTIGEFWSDPLNWVDLLAIIPSYLELIIWGAAYNFVAGGGEEIVVLRIMKLCKVFRVFKLMKHFDGTDVLISTIKGSLDALSIPFFFLMLFNLLFASFMFNIETPNPIYLNGKVVTGSNSTGYEPATYNDIMHTVWFMFVTMTTTGYGDQNPSSTFGKILAAISAIFGILFLAMPLTIVGASFYNNWNAHLKKMEIKERLLTAELQAEKYVEKQAALRGVTADVIRTEKQNEDEETSLVVPARLAGPQRDVMTTYFQFCVSLNKMYETVRAMSQVLNEDSKIEGQEENLAKMAKSISEQFKKVYILSISMHSLMERVVKAKGLTLLRRVSNKIVLDIKMRRWASMYGRDGNIDNVKKAEKLERGWKDKVFLLLEVPESSTWARHIAHISIVIILASILIFVLESDVTLHGDDGMSSLQWFLLETFFTIVFSIEFILRAVVTPDRTLFMKDTLNWFDLVAILPFYIEFLVGLFSGEVPWNVETSGAVGQVLKLVKLCRVLRVFKMTRQFPGSRLLYKTALYSYKALTVPMFFLLVFVLMFAAMLFYLEPGVWVDGTYVYADTGEENPFQSIFSTFWIIIITITTVGYGDQSPKTVTGQFICVLAMIFGILYTAMPLAIVGSYFFDAYEAQQKALVDPKSASNALQKLLTPRAKLKCEQFQQEGKSIMGKIKSEFGENLTSRVATLGASGQEELKKSIESVVSHLEDLQSNVFELMEVVQCLGTGFIAKA